MEFFNSDSGKLNTEAVIFAIWRNRTNNELVNAYCDILSKFVDEKDVVDEIEFYLPQLAHMIIHLEVDWNTSHLERFTLILSQTSMHAALQLTYILYAAMEDYQPEDGKGMRNPRFNSKIFLRCARLIKNIERAVVYCPPLLSYQTGYESNIVHDLSNEEELVNTFKNLGDLEKEDQADISRTRNSKFIIDKSNTIEANIIKGPLYQKRGNRKLFQFKSWKLRWFKIEQRMLLCYRDENYIQLKRGIPLLGCSISEYKYKTIEHYFEIHSSLSKTTYRLYAKNENDYKKWVDAIREESGTHKIPRSPSLVTSEGFSPDPEGSATHPSTRSNFSNPSHVTTNSSRSDLSDVSNIPSAIANSSLQSGGATDATVMESLESLRIGNAAEDTQGYPTMKFGLSGFNGDVSHALFDKEDQRGRGASMNRMLVDLRADLVTEMHEGKLTPLQLKRYAFFHNQNKFLNDLTDISERLRFLDKDQRSRILAEELKAMTFTPGVYIPLCNSTDLWYYVRAVLPQESHAFTTKARCPCLVFFECERHPEEIDVASYLAMHQWGLFDNSYGNSATPISSAPGSIRNIQALQHESSVASSISDPRMPNAPQNSPTMGIHSGNSVIWRKGAGIKRVFSTASMTSLPNEIKESLEVLAESSKSRDIGTMSSFRSALTTSSRSVEPVDPDQIEFQLSAVENGGSSRSGLFSSPRESDSKSGTPVGGVDSGPRSDFPESVITSPVIDSMQRVFGERFAEKSARLQAQSVFIREMHGKWTLMGALAKSNDDLRQEVLVMQLIKYIENIFKSANLPLWLFTYRIMNTSKSTGLIELIPDATSLDGLKRRSDWPGSLRAHFEKSYKGPQLQYAIRNYLNSLAAYSIVAYVFAIKDRHNGNIMIDAEGHLIHIDFGFVFGLAPGKQFSMETAPWKLSVEMAEVIGGPTSDLYKEFLSLVGAGLREVRKHSTQLSTMMEIMSHSSNFPGFRYNSNAIIDFKSRLHLNVSDSELDAVVEKLASRSYNHSGANHYDTFQLMTNGIAK